MNHDPFRETSRRASELAAPLCEAEGLELVHVVCLTESGRRILRVYIDKPGGVSLDDCTQVSRQLGDLLDVALENSSRYILEVSSPGLNRPLVKQQDFERFAGKRAHVRLQEPMNGQRNFKGILKGWESGNILMQMETGEVALPFDRVAAAKLDDDGEI